MEDENDSKLVDVEKESDNEQKNLEEVNVSEEVVHPDVIEKMKDLLNSKGIRDYSIDISSGSKKGDNYLGVIAKVRVDGTDDDGNKIEINWIVKSAPQIEAFRELVKVDQVYVREILMYEKILPQFQLFRAEKNVIDEFGVTPVHIMSCLDSNRESFVMEDMKALGYVMGDRTKPLDLNHVRLVMKAYAKLHAVSYALKDQKPKEFEQISRDTEEQFFKEHLEEMAKGQEIYHKRVLGNLDPVNDVNIIKVYEKYAAKSTAIVLETMELAGVDPFSVVGHGDSWINNMLFKYGDPGNPKIPTKVCLLDWQLARYGSPAFDLSYFIFACTDKTLRDKHYDEMIKLYYYTMCGHIVELGSSDPESLIPFEVLRAHLKRYSIFGLYISTMVLQLMVSEVDEIPDWTDSSTQEEMLEAYQYESKNQAVCNARVRGNVVDLFEKGCFDFLQ